MEKTSRLQSKQANFLFIDLIPFIFTFHLVFSQCLSLFYHALFDVTTKTEWETDMPNEKAIGKISITIVKYNRISGLPHFSDNFFICIYKGDSVRTKI